MQENLRDISSVEKPLGLVGANGSLLHATCGRLAQPPVKAMPVQGRAQLLQPPAYGSGLREQFTLLAETVESVPKRQVSVANGNAPETTAAMREMECGVQCSAPVAEKVLEFVSEAPVSALQENVLLLANARPAQPCTTGIPVSCSRVISLDVVGPSPRVPETAEVAETHVEVNTSLALESVNEYGAPADAGKPNVPEVEVPIHIQGAFEPQEVTLKDVFISAPVKWEKVGMQGLGGEEMPAPRQGAQCEELFPGTQEKTLFLTSSRLSPLPTVAAQISGIAQSLEKPS